MKRLSRSIAAIAAGRCYDERALREAMEVFRGDAEAQVVIKLFLTGMSQRDKSGASRRLLDDLSARLHEVGA